MKIFSSSPIKIDFAAFMGRFYEDLKPLITRAWSYTKSSFIKIHQFHPPKYVTLFITPKSLDAVLFDQGRVVSSKSIKIDDYSFKELDHILEENDTPLNIVVLSSDVEFKALGLKGVNPWDRASLVSQFGFSSFQETDWLASYKAPSPDDRNRRVFVSCRPPAFAGELFSWLEKRKNPLLRIQHMALPYVNIIQQEARAVLETKKKQGETPSKLMPWSVIVRSYESDGWQILVTHNEAIILCRQGYLNQDSLLETNLTKEILSTLKFVQRFGFIPENGFTFIINGLKDKIELPKHYPHNSINIEKNVTASWLQLPVTGLFSWIRRLFSAPTLQTSTFLPQVLFSHVASFWLTRYVAAITVPLVYFSLVGSLLLGFKNIRYSARTEAVAGLLQAQKEKMSDLEKRLVTASLYEYSLKREGLDPVAILRTLAKTFGPYGVASEIRWSQEGSDQARPKNGYAGEWAKKALSLTLQVNPASFSGGKKGKNSGSKITSVEELKSKIEQALSKEYSGVRLEWLPVQGSSHVWNMKVVFP